MNSLAIISLAVAVLLPTLSAAEQFGRQESLSGIRHSFLIAGPVTVLVGEDGKVQWRTKGSSFSSSFPHSFLLYEY